MSEDQKEDQFERNYRDDVLINRYKLDDECSNHPSVYLYWSEQLAETKGKLDKLKAVLELKASEIELELRRNPPEGLKVTESVIVALVKTNVDVSRIAREWNEKRKKVNLLSAAVVSLEHKKSQLDNLRHLYIAGYYSRSEGSQKESGTDQAEDAARTRLNKSKEENNE